jgi:hypothetical protein
VSYFRQNCLYFEFVNPGIMSTKRQESFEANEPMNLGGDIRLQTKSSRGLTSKSVLLALPLRGQYGV